MATSRISASFVRLFIGNPEEAAQIKKREELRAFMIRRRSGKQHVSVWSGASPHESSVGARRSHLHAATQPGQVLQPAGLQRCSSSSPISLALRQQALQQVLEVRVGLVAVDLCRVQQAHDDPAGGFVRPRVPLRQPRGGSDSPESKKAHGVAAGRWGRTCSNPRVKPCGATDRWSSSRSTSDRIASPGSRRTRRRAASVSLSATISTCC